MEKQSLFALLFSSWIFGISLICIFPPVPDYRISDQSQTYLSKDAVPEIHQRNAAQSLFSYPDSLPEFINLAPVNAFDFHFVQFFIFVKVKASIQSVSYFDTLLLFKAFFETW